MPERNTAGIIKIIKDRKNNAAKIEWQEKHIKTLIKCGGGGFCACFWFNNHYKSKHNFFSIMTKIQRWVNEVISS